MRRNHPRLAAVLAAAFLTTLAGVALAGRIGSGEAASVHAAPVLQGIQATGVVTLGTGTCFPDAVLMDCDSNVVAQMKGPGGAAFFTPYLNKHVRITASTQTCPGGDTYLSVVTIAEEPSSCGPAGTQTAQAPTATSLPPATATPATPPTATTVPGGGTGNLAQGMPIHASSSQVGFPPELAVDGNEGTHWASNPGYDWNAPARNTQWIYVDLGTEVNVGQMRMLWGAQRHARSYSVHVWDDARRTWIGLGSTASGDGDDTWTVRSSVSLRGRYFMLWLVNPHFMGGHYELREWRIAGVGSGGSGGAANLALNRPVQALSSDPAYPMANAVDGNAATEWRPLAVPVWIYVDLGSAQTVDRAILRWSAGLHGTDYTLYAWTGTSWSPIYTQRGGRGGDESFAFRAVRAQYILLYVAQAAGPTVGLRELELYPYGSGTPGGGGLATPTPPLPPIPFAGAQPWGRAASDASGALSLQGASAPASDLGGPSFAPRPLFRPAPEQRLDERVLAPGTLPAPVGQPGGRGSTID